MCLDYYNYCFTNETRHWELDFISLFATLQILGTSENFDTLFLDDALCNYNCNARLSPDYVVQPMKDCIVKVATVAYRDSHFAVLVLHLHDKSVSIYDGLALDDSEADGIWQGHIDFLVHRTTGHPISGDYHIKKANTLGSIVHRQEDGYNCGPIACVTVWYLFNLEGFQQMTATRKFKSLGD